MAGEWHLIEAQALAAVQRHADARGGADTGEFSGDQFLASGY
jgi:hypothetical protein